MAKATKPQELNTCPVTRRILVTHGTLNMRTGASHADRQEWVTRECGVPLFGAQRAIGKCKACADGWTHPHNYPVAQDPAPAETMTRPTALDVQLAEFEGIGERHHAEGIPRNANPFLIAAYNNGARKAHTRPSVLAWWRGWDRAQERQADVEAFAQASAAIARWRRGQEAAQ